MPNKVNFSFISCQFASFLPDKINNIFRVCVAKLYCWKTDCSQFLFENPDKFDAREWLKPAREAAKQICKQRYIEFGCEGQGAKIKHTPLPMMAAKYQQGMLAQVVN